MAESKSAMSSFSGFREKNLSFKIFQPLQRQSKRSVRISLANRFRKSEIDFYKPFCQAG
jgi:hypothetical protein